MHVILIYGNSSFSRIEEARDLMRMKNTSVISAKQSLMECAISISPLDVLYKKAALKNFTNFKGKHLQ